MSDIPDAVRYSVDQSVATITLNQPDRRNALSREIEIGIEAGLDAARESDARCLVLEGAGEAFCAGGDIERMQEWLDSGESLDTRISELEATTNALMRRLVEFPLPTVSKIDGAAVGAGANLAIATDIQLASERARIGFVFRGVGLSVDAGTSYLLPRLVGENTAKELVFTGDIIDAETALDLGIVNHVYPTASFDEQAHELIQEIATGPTVALRQAKRLLGTGLEKSLDAALRDEARSQSIVFESADHREGVEAFLDGRAPEFTGS